MAIAMTGNEPETLTFLFTGADVAALPCGLPSGDVKYELDNGKLIVMPPPGDLHGAYQSNLATELKVQGEQQGHGKCRVESGVLLWEDPDTLVGPDAMFITNKKLPLRCSSEGYLLTIPELVVEVRSKNDSKFYVDQKVRDYMKAGVEVVWVVDAAQKAVVEYRPGTEPRTHTLGEVLTLDDLIPGFRMSVADVFRE